MLPSKIGCSIDTLRYWLRQHERDVGGGDAGLKTAEPPTAEGVGAGG